MLVEGQCSQRGRQSHGDFGGDFVSQRVRGCWYSGLGGSKSGGLEMMNMCLDCVLDCFLWSCFQYRITELLVPRLTLLGRVGHSWGESAAWQGERGWFLDFLHHCVPDTDSEDLRGWGF